MNSGNTPLSRTPLQPKSLSKNIQNVNGLNNDSKMKSTTPLKFPELNEKEGKGISFNVNNFNSNINFSFEKTQNIQNNLQSSYDQTELYYNKNKTCCDETHGMFSTNFKIADYDSQDSTGGKTNPLSSVINDEGEVDHVRKAMNFFENEQLTYFSFSEMQQREDLYEKAEKNPVFTEMEEY